MITTFNAKKVAELYSIGYSTYLHYLSRHRAELNQLAKKRLTIKNTEVKPQNYNSEQLRYIIYEILGDCPEGWCFNGKTLIKEANV